MADMGFTPNLQASGNIKPFRFVTVSGAFQGAVASNLTVQQIGVTDGSIYQASLLNSSGYHAISGTPITLQPSNTVQIELGGSVSAGDYLMPEGTVAAPSTEGRAILAAGATAVCNYIALEAGASGEVIRAFRFGQRGPIFS